MAQRFMDAVRTTDTLQAPTIHPEPANTVGALWGGPPVTLTAQGDESLRDVAAFNAGLTRAYATDVSICWILARVRVEFLRCTPSAYETLLGKPLANWATGSERAPASEAPRYEAEKFTKIFRQWDAIAVQRTDEALTANLTEAKERILDAMGSKEWSAAFRTYYRWRIEVGPDNFDAKAGVTYGQLWGRDKNRNETPLSEMVDVAKRIGLVPDTLMGRELLDHPRIAQARAAWLTEGVARNRLAPMVSLMGLLQLNGLATTARALEGEPLKLVQRTAGPLARYEPIRWSTVARVCELLQREGLLDDQESAELGVNWEHCIALEPERFDKRLARLASERGLSNEVLADALGLYEKIVTKPALPVFRALSYGEFYKGVSPANLAVLLAGTSEEFESLLEHARSEFRINELRAGRPGFKIDLIERSIWGLDDATYKSILTTVGKNAVSEDLISPIRVEGIKQLRVPLTWALNGISPRSVADVYKGQTSRLGNPGVAAKIGTSRATAVARADGTEIPSLREFKSDLEHLGVSNSTELEMAWRNGFAVNEVMCGASDLERVLLTIQAEVASSRREFLDLRKLSADKVQLPLQTIQATGTLGEQDLKKLLANFGLTAGTPQYQFTTYVHREGSIAGAISPFAEELRFDERHLRAVAKNALTAFDKLSPTELLTARFNVGEKKERSTVLERMRQMPGVTLAELQGAAVKVSSEVVRILTAKIASDGVTPRELALILDGMISGDKRPSSAAASALGKYIASRVVAPTTLACVAAENADQLTERIKFLELAAKARLETFGGRASQLAQSMWMTGTEQDDLGKLRKDFGVLLYRALLGDSAEVVKDDPVALLEKNTLDRIATIGDERSRTAVRQIAELQEAYHPRYVVALCEAGTPGGTATIVPETGISFSGIKEFKAGTHVPTLPQLKKMCSLASLEWRAGYEIGWRIAYPAQFKGTPLSRGILTMVASDQKTFAHLVKAGVTISAVSGEREVRLLRGFALAHEIAPDLVLKGYRTALNAPATVSERYINQVASAMDEPLGSSRVRFLVNLITAPSTRAAYDRWLTVYGGNEMIRRGIESTRTWLDTSPLPAKDEDLPAAAITQLVEWRGGLTAKRRTLALQEVLEFVERLPGMTRADFRAPATGGTYGPSATATAVAKAPVVLTEPTISTPAPKPAASSGPVVTVAKETKVSRPPPAVEGIVFTADHKRLPTDEKFMLVSLYVSDNDPVSYEGLLELLPEHRARLNDLQKKWGSDDLVYLVATIGFFKFPKFAFDSLIRKPSPTPVGGKRAFDACAKRASTLGTDLGLRTLDNNSQLEVYGW